MFRPDIGSKVRDVNNIPFTVVRAGLPVDCDHTWIWLGASYTLKTKQQGVCEGYYQCTKCNMVVSRHNCVLNAPAPAFAGDEELVDDAVVQCRSAAGYKTCYEIYLPDENCSGVCDHAFEFMLMAEHNQSNMLEAFFRCTVCGAIWIQTLGEINKFPQTR